MLLIIVQIPNGAAGHYLLGLIYKYVFCSVYAFFLDSEWLR